MDELSSRFHRLGKTVAGISDRTADLSAIDAARRRWIAPAVPRRRRSLLAFAAFAAAAFLLAIAAVWTKTEPSALSFEFGAPPVRGAVGEWVAAGAEAPLCVRFSEGTLLTLAPGARMRVTKTSARGADILIERGTLHAAVVHAEGDTRWAVLAGPFDVRVIGTSFDAGWDPTTETFDLLMKEGSVSVSGPLLRPGRILIAGEHLVVLVREGRMQLTTATADPPGAPSSAPAKPFATVNATAPPPGDPSSAPRTADEHRIAGGASPAAAPPPRATWKDLAAAGKYRDALAAVEQAGFPQEIERASAGDLLALSDAARFAGRPERAREALLALRRRFGAKGHSAFLLGKIAADQQGAAADAVTWFETSLEEEPSGALAEQALGRILEIKKRRDSEAAKPIAARYLAKYPSGAYAPLARSLLAP
jgi:hypothetical protein